MHCGGAICRVFAVPGVQQGPVTSGSRLVRSCALCLLRWVSKSGTPAKNASGRARQIPLSFMALPRTLLALPISY